MGGLWYTEIDEELSARSETKGIKEGDSPIALSTFHCKLDYLINAVNVIQECLFMGLWLDDPCVIHKPVPYLGGLIADARAFLSKYSMYRLATMGLTSEPIAAPSTCS